MTIHRFSFPTDIRFGLGARSLLPGVLQEAGVRRPLVVTDKGVSSLPFLADLLTDLERAGLSPRTFDGVWGNPVVSQVDEGVAAYRSHAADSIVGVGGGAALDVAKAIGLMATHDGHLFDYEDEASGTRPIEDRIPWFVALPTTAGTGSEVGRSAVIADDETHVKKIIFSPYLLARCVLADPELTVGLPASITAATGLDALTHNIEAYLAKGYHPICDGIALEGLRLGAANLARAVANPTDLDARGAMLMSSMMGAIAFQKGLGVVHSTAHALGTVADLHHGLANGVMIDVALVHNVEAVPERFETMALTIGLDDASAAGFLAWLADLKAQVGIPANLVEANVDRARLDDLASFAFADACHLNNPRPCTRDDFVHIFERAFDGG
ncbi:MAG: iron-containing alcohol dehydrogenase [Acidimicrobiales bacterium]|nr:iron-containing alcohol dehydrogenase [Acidimicrobiales bacterium]